MVLCLFGLVSPRVAVSLLGFVQKDCLLSGLLQLVGLDCVKVGGFALLSFFDIIWLFNILRCKPLEHGVVGSSLSRSPCLSARATNKQEREFLCQVEGDVVLSRPN